MVTRQSKFVQPPLLETLAEPTPRMQLITDFEATEGVMPCVTCHDGLCYQLKPTEGSWKRLDQDGRWSRCNACGARPLNNAQRADVIFALENSGQVLFNACLGARKTGTGIAIANQYKGVWVVVTPARLLTQWANAIKEWATSAEIHIMDQKNKTALIDLKEDHSAFAFHLISWDTLARRDFSKYRNIEGALYDEIHRMASEGVTMKAASKVNSVRRIGLSGTPAANRLSMLFYVLRWIWWGNKDHRNKQVFRRFDVKIQSQDGTPGWLTRHFEILQSKYGGPYSIEVGAEKVRGSVVAEIPAYVVHLENETCCEWHPGGVNATLPPALPTENIYVEMTPLQRRLYEKADSSDPVLWLNADTGQLESTMVDTGLVEDLRKQQIALAVPSLKSVQVTNADGEIETKMAVTMETDAESGSIDALIDLLYDIVQPNDPVLVVTHSKVFAKIVVTRIRAAKKLDFPVAEWSGDIKDTDREKIKTWFGRDGGPQVIVASIPAIAEGTDGLQAVCRQEVWLSEMRGNVMLNKQMRGRLPRTGQQRPTKRYNIIVRNTILEDITIANDIKEADLDASLRPAAFNTPKVGVAQLYDAW